MEWYPHYVDDYDADTLGLTLAEDGAYCRLLRWYYKHERPLPGEDTTLAAICRVPIDEWHILAQKIKPLFRPKENGRGLELHHKRCNEVIWAQTRKRKDATKRQEKLRKNGLSEAS